MQTLFWRWCSKLFWSRCKMIKRMLYFLRKPFLMHNVSMFEQPELNTRIRLVSFTYWCIDKTLTATFCVFILSSITDLERRELKRWVCVRRFCGAEKMLNTGFFDIEDISNVHSHSHAKRMVLVLVYFHIWQSA